MALSAIDAEPLKAQSKVHNKQAAELLNTRIYPLRDVENGVKIQKISYPNRLQINVVANLFLPPNYDRQRNMRPSLLVIHSEE